MVYNLLLFCLVILYERAGALHLSANASFISRSEDVNEFLYLIRSCFLDGNFNGGINDKSESEVTQKNMFFIL